MEQRARIIEIAAFLDRLDRSVSHDAEDDFRIAAFRQALKALASGEPSPVETVQMILSDPDTELLPRRDQQSAEGASRRRALEA